MMKITLLALAFVLLSFQVNADYLNIKTDTSNPEITIDDVIITDHQITNNGMSCFSRSCAYEYYIKTHNERSRVLLRRDYRYPTFIQGFAIGVRY